MRKIKFRAWNIERRVMYNVGDLTIRKEWIGSNSVNKLDKIGDTIGMNYLNRDKVEFELMQFTGLKDKNGKGIFEGDICLVNDGSVGKKRQVIYSEEKASFMYKIIEDVYSSDFRKLKSELRYIMKYDYMKTSDIEIIGNIHENPELIK